MLPRTAFQTLRQWAGIFRVLVISGARQSGKTTLARAVFPQHPYRSLENPDTRQLAQEDPRGFLAGLSEGGILDEVQRAPQLLSYLQEVVDTDTRPGRWVLTGSAQFHLIETVTQSLAGRAGVIELPTCSRGELLQGDCAPETLASSVLRGGYPEPLTRNLPSDIWYNAYLSSVLERDLRQVLQVRDLDAFQRFVRLCAGRVGQVVNRAALGADAGIDASTVERWLSALQAAQLVFVLRPHYRNFGKRLVKAPKLYFSDSGVLTRLLGIRDEEQLRLHPQWGSMVENWVIAEVRRAFLNRGESPPLWYWRDHSGTEIDCLIDQGGVLSPLEIKAGATVATDWFRPLQRWQQWAGEASGPARIIYGGQEKVPGPHGIPVLPWHQAGWGVTGEREG